MKGDDIAERLLEFAVRIIKLSDALEGSPSARHVGAQVVRSGTSAGANYEEARGAESKKDIVHELGISLKELRETRYWLKVICKASLVSEDRMKDILLETDELCRIVGQSILTAKGKAKGKS